MVSVLQQFFCGTIMKRTFITCLVGFGIILAGAVQTEANKAGTLPAKVFKTLGVSAELQAPSAR